MIKYLLIVINSLFLFVYGIFNGDNGITITSNFPEVMVAGKETAIEIIVNKGSMGGFAKLQIELPSDFVVKQAEDKGATYTFNEGVAKWVWAALPTESEIVIKMVVVPSESTRGPKTVSGKYSYVENNVKQVVEMTPVEVNIVSEGETPVVTASEPVAATPDSTSQATNVELPVQVTSNIETPGAISVIRTKTQISPAEYEIKLVIGKGSSKGFARYSDDLPGDVIVKGAETDGASFSVADRKIKFVWVNVPEKDSLRISYTMLSSRTQVVELKGEYSYLEDNQSKKYKVEASSVLFELPVVAKTETPDPTPVAVKPVEQKPAENKPTNKAVPEKKVVAKKEKTAKNRNAKPTQLSPVMAQGMFYQVQIGAFSKIKASAARLERKFKVTEVINTEMQNGFSKFMVGSHPEYKEARDHREAVIADNGIKSAFVVAYNQGKRITVQEALMVSNQKWFK